MVNFHNQSAVANQVQTQYIQGDAYFSLASPPPRSPASTPASSQNYSVGTRLNQAPQIDSDYFVGREPELQKLQTWLTPIPGKQNLVALWGMGGMGKTQLSVHFARQSANTYSAVFWLNAKDEVTLKAGLATLATEAIDTAANSVITTTQDEERLVRQARDWLSLQQNDRWLIVFDNYDDPKMPGIASTTGFDIRNYFPLSAQGSILITTRSPRLTFAKQLPLRKLEDMTESLAILAARSGRSLDQDHTAIKLAQRLDGLPLALATAGVYLGQWPDSFEEYLQLYEHGWNELHDHDRGPEDYEERALYTTWQVSLQQVQAQDPAAAELLSLMAYFDNHNLRYELFHAGYKLRDAPQWWIEVSQSRLRFNRAMSVLRDYSLLEVNPGGYSIHTCVHDWTLEHLNQNINPERYRIAAHTVARSVTLKTKPEYWVKNQAVLPHARRLLHHRLRTKLVENLVSQRDLCSLVELFRQSDMYQEAQDMCEQALNNLENTLGPKHVSTLSTTNRLGTIYSDVGKLDEAERLYERALTGREQVLGPDHSSTLDTVHNLGHLYRKQGKLEKAEEMLERALARTEKLLGPDHTSTLSTVNNLGMIYDEQGKYKEAQQMYERALAGSERVLGPDHTSTLHMVNNLAGIHAEQGKYEEAEHMYRRALAGRVKALGPDHTMSISTANNLAIFYKKRGKIDQAEQMLLQTLARSTRALGSNHPRTLKTIDNLGWLYAGNGGLPAGWERTRDPKGGKYIANEDARVAALEKLRS